MKAQKSILLACFHAALLACLCVAGSSALAGLKPVSRLVSQTFTDLKEFEGFFQFPNRVAYVRIFRKGDVLIAKQIWDGMEYSLIRKSDQVFESQNEEYKLEFIKDNEGKVSGLKVLNRIILTRVNFDPQKTVDVSPEKLYRLTGKYQLEKDSTYFLEIGVADGQLQLKQLWDGKIVQFAARSETDFFNTELSFPLTFTLLANEAKQLLAFTDVWKKIN